MRNASIALMKVPQAPDNLRTFIACRRQWENGMIIRLGKRITNAIALYMMTIGTNNALIDIWMGRR